MTPEESFSEILDSANHLTESKDYYMHRDNVRNLSRRYIHRVRRHREFWIANATTSLIMVIAKIIENKL